MKSTHTADNSAPTTRKPQAARAVYVVTRRKRCTKPQPLEAASLPDSLLTISTVGAVTGLSASSVFRKLAAGEFPEPVRMGSRCTRWHSASVRAWLAAQKTK